MTKERIESYYKKGAVVIWTCATPNGMAHLFYLKSCGNGEYCLMRENYFDDTDTRVAPNGNNWVAENEAKLSLLITMISNKLRMSTIAMKKIYIRGIKEAVQGNEARKEELEENKRLAKISSFKKGG